MMTPTHVQLSSYNRPIVLELNAAERQALGTLMDVYRGVLGRGIGPEEAISRLLRRGADLAVLEQIAPPAPAIAGRHRTYRGCLPPEVSHVFVEGSEALRVALVGAHGRGHWMTVDPDTWEAAKLAHGDQWTRDRSRSGAWYVGSLAQREVRMARLAFGARNATLRYRNGDYLDCRRSNLVTSDLMH